MRLVHWSADIVTTVHGRRQVDPLDPKHRRHINPGKPAGLWVSDETRGAHGWRAWARDQSFRSYSFRYEHEIVLSPKAKIKYLRSAKDIDRFTKTYGYSLLNLLGNTRESHLVDGIDWRRLARNGYHGIIITPYIWERRLGLEAHWYYTWDCASGCIWNARAIESITMVRERKVPHKPTYWERKRAHKRQMIRMAEASKQIVAALAEARPGPDPLRDAIVKSADNLIASYEKADS